ncbi:hypothetical protein G6F62_015615 [Rhizopus arrhizus]|nr:hypothetical protein G6F66_014634 [Rhizopus arrhizus]KAG1305207.1 hypothetical protein G6F62_015615 [Rhizopus arrhizus]KAG1316283.1 hypothetical protein G6F63_016091 [Rhizopus arrhizus]KAG1388421.1 hypothetical protein G6F58_013496 [Rhizopus delemar]
MPLDKAREQVIAAIRADRQRQASDKAADAREAAAEPDAGPAAQPAGADPGHPPRDLQCAGAGQWQAELRQG